MTIQGIPAVTRMELFDFSSAEWKTCLSNPSEIVEAVSPIWNKKNPIGSTSGRYHWMGTDSRPISFSLYFDADLLEETWGSLVKGSLTGSTPLRRSEALMDWRRFLMHFCYPVQRDDGTSDDCPDAVFVWDNFMSFRTKIMSISFRYSRWQADGNIDIFTADLRLETISDLLITSQDARTEGPERVEFILE